MNSLKMAGVALIVAGVLALVFGGFSYTRNTQAVKLGSIELSVKETRTVNIPLWGGVGAIALGGVLLILGARKR